MTVYVNDREVHLVPGMTVRHALIAAGLWEQMAEGKKVYDDHDHEVGPDGVLMDGDRVYVR